MDDRNIYQLLLRLLSVYSGTYRLSCEESTEGVDCSRDNHEDDECDSEGIKAGHCSNMVMLK